MARRGAAGVKMAPLGVALLLMLLEQEAEADASSFGRRRERVRGRHELRRRRGGEGLGAHDGHLPLRGVVLRHAVEEAAGGAVLAVPARVVHAGPPRRGRRLGVAEREAAAVGAASGGPDVVVVGVERVGGGAVVPELVVGEGRVLVVVVVGASAGAREAPGRAGLQRAEHGRRRGRGLAVGGELGARGGDEGVEQVVRAEGEADELLVAVVLDEQQAHHPGRVLRVQLPHPVEHHLGGLPGVHGVRDGSQDRSSPARSYQVGGLLKRRRKEGEGR